MLRLTPSPAACDQVLDVDGWSDRLGLDTRHVGTAMTPDEVFCIITKVDLAALRGYRAATGAATVAAVNALCAPDGAYRNERAQWMDQFWAGHDVARFLSFLNVHTTERAIGEALAVRGLLGTPLGP